MFICRAGLDNVRKESATLPATVTIRAGAWGVVHPVRIRRSQRLQDTVVFVRNETRRVNNMSCDVKRI